MRQNTLSIKEAADYLGVHSDTIYTMVRQKQIPHFKIRRRIFLSRDRLDKWIGEQESKVGQEAM